MMKLVLIFLMITLMTQNMSVLEKDILEFEMDVLEGKSNEVNTLQSSSWQPWVDLILKDPAVKGAGIFGQVSGATWAASNFGLYPGEVLNIVAGILE
jgi:hypothetical protein